MEYAPLLYVYCLEFEMLTLGAETWSDRCSDHSLQKCKSLSFQFPRMRAVQLYHRHFALLI